MAVQLPPITDLPNLKVSQTIHFPSFSPLQMEGHSNIRNFNALKTTCHSLHTESLTINVEFMKTYYEHSNKASQKLGYQTPMVQKGRDTDGIDTLPLAGQCSLNGDHLVQLFSLK